MKIVQSPKKLTQNQLDATYTSLFLAGGISNCPNWQETMCERLKSYTQGNADFFNHPTNSVVFNPRRKGDLVKNGADAKTQILWEHRYLLEATEILFWFPKETLCPITLFELGKYAQYYKNLYGGFACNHFFVGIHPEYQRKFDLEVQLKLIFPEIVLQYSLDDLFNQVVTQMNLVKG